MSRNFTPKKIIFVSRSNVVEVRQAEMHTAEPLAPVPSNFEVELAIEKRNSYRSSGIDQNPAELIKENNSLWDP